MGRFMQITRGIRPERNFAIISNYVLRDSALSYRARGVLCCILSFAEGFQISSDRLAEMGKEGRDAIRSALSELEAAGYLKRAKVQDEKGLWSSSAVINDVPDLSVRTLPAPGAQEMAPPAPAPAPAPAPSAQEVAPAEPKTDSQASVNRRLENRQSDSQAVKEDQKEDKKKKEAPAPVIPKISFDGVKFNDLSEDQIALWAGAYPAIDVPAQIKKAAVWLDANPANKKSDYKRFLNGWLCRAQDKAPPKGPASAPRQAAPRYPANTHKYAGAAAAIWGNDNNDSRTVDA